MIDQQQKSEEPTSDEPIRRQDRGAGLVEYALLVALIALVCLASLQAFGITNGGSINNTVSSYGAAVN